MLVPADVYFPIYISLLIIVDIVVIINNADDKTTQINDGFLYIIELSVLYDTAHHIITVAINSTLAETVLSLDMCVLAFSSAITPSTTELTDCAFSSALSFLSSI